MTTKIIDTQDSDEDDLIVIEGKFHRQSIKIKGVIRMKVDTVNVIVWEDGTLQSLNAFTEDDVGSKQAEDAFSALAIGHGCPVDDVDSYVEDGHYEKNGWEVLLAHSS